MITVNMKGLVEKLNPTLRNTLEGSAGLAMSNGHYNVEIEHWLAKVLEQPHTDLLQLLEKFEIDADQLIKQINTAIAEFKGGNTRPPALSENILHLITQSWLLGSVEYRHPQVTSGHLLTALMLDHKLSGQLTYTLPALNVLSGESLKAFAPKIIGKTSESALLESAAASAGGGRGNAPVTGQGTALEKYTVNLTEKAKAGDIDPVLGRDDEIRQLVDILLRRRQNNPILTGEAGVGKTAVVEGFANKVVAGEVPEPLQGITLLSLDLGLLEAGASVKGEFENRLKNVIQEIKDSPDPIILFIDEAHQLVGAGGREGQGDAANLMKPALARGELRTLAATTWAEYKKYFEKDPALTRRFQVVKVDEPDEGKAIDMMRGIARHLEDHHKVTILDEAVEAAVKLSSRYIPARQLPDKAVSLLDTACAKVALSQTSIPAAVETINNNLVIYRSNLETLNKEQQTIGGVEDKIQQYQELIENQEAQLVPLKEQWDKELELADLIKEKTGALDEGDSDAMEELTNLRQELKSLQQDSPLIHLEVSQGAVAEIVANWTGIPVGRMAADEIEGVLNLADTLQDRVRGQDHALEAIAEAIKTSRAGLTDVRKPVGVFMLIGPSGTGKTESALSLAETLFGGEQNLITINMSEFKEEHKVSMLLGAPAGYVGYGEGGVLTEAVRRKPYSVVLLDEMEKAHPGIQDIFYNLFDKGTIKDGEGRDIDFKNTVIIMTSNACSGTISALCEGAELPDTKELLEQVRPELLQHFRPAFLGRSKVIPFYPLKSDILAQIVGINMKRIEKRIAGHYGADFSFDENLVDYIVSKCKDPDTGARNVENVIDRQILPLLAKQCLSRLSEGEQVTQVDLGYQDDELVIEVN